MLVSVRILKSTVSGTLSALCAATWLWMIIPESSARCARRHRVRRIVLCVLTDPCTCQIDSVWQRTDESWCYLVKYDNDSALHTAGCWVTTSPWWSFRRLQIMLLDNVSAVKIKKKYIYVPLDASTAALHNHVHRFCFPHLVCFLNIHISHQK